MGSICSKIKKMKLRHAFICLLSVALWVLGGAHTQAAELISPTTSVRLPFGSGGYYPFSSRPNVIEKIIAGGGSRSGVSSSPIWARYVSHTGYGDQATIGLQLRYKLDILRNGQSLQGISVHRDDYGPTVYVGDVIEFKALVPETRMDCVGSTLCIFAPAPTTPQQPCTGNTSNFIVGEHVVGIARYGAGRVPSQWEIDRGLAAFRASFPAGYEYHGQLYSATYLSLVPISVRQIDGGVRDIYASPPTSDGDRTNFSRDPRYALIEGKQQLSPARLECQGGGTVCTVKSPGYIQVAVSQGPTPVSLILSHRLSEGPHSGLCRQPQTTTDIFDEEVFSAVLVARSAPLAPAPPIIDNCPRVTDIGSQESFTFRASDPNGDKIRYLLYWDGAVSPSETIPASGQSNSFRSVTSGTNQTVARSWQAEGGHTLVVRAQEVLGGSSAADPLRFGETSEGSAVCSIAVGSNLRVTTDPATNVSATAATLNGVVSFNDLQSELLRKYMQNAAVGTLSAESVVRPYLSVAGKGLVNPEHPIVKEYRNPDDSWNWTLSIDRPAQLILGPLSERNVFGVPTRLKSDFVFDAGSSGAIAWFEWGQVADLSDAISTSEQVVTPGVISAPIQNLSLGRTYYFRALAKRANGSLVRGSIRSFQVAASADTCPNIEGLQTRIPDGMVKDGTGNCVAASTRNQPTLSVVPLLINLGTVSVGASDVHSFFVVSNTCGNNCESMSWTAQVISGPYTFDPILTQGTVLSGNTQAHGTHLGGTTPPNIIRLLANTAGPARNAPGAIRVTSNAPINGTQNVQVNLCLGECVPVSALEVHTRHFLQDPTDRGKVYIYGSVNVASSDANVKNFFRWGTAPTASGLNTESAQITTRDAAGGFFATLTSLASGTYYYQAISKRGLEPNVYPTPDPEIRSFTICADGSAVARATDCSGPASAATLRVEPVTLNLGTIAVGADAAAIRYGYGNSWNSIFRVSADCPAGQTCSPPTWTATITSGPYTFKPGSAGTISADGKSVSGTVPITNIVRGANGQELPALNRSPFDDAAYVAVVPNTAGPARALPGTVRVTSNAAGTPTHDVGITLCLGTCDAPPPATEIDLGLRYTDGTNVYPIAVQALGTTPTSPLRVTDGTRVYAVPLVAASSADATPIRFRTASGILALKRYRATTAVLPLPSNTAALSDAFADIPASSRSSRSAERSTLEALAPDFSFLRVLVAPWVGE